MTKHFSNRRCNIFNAHNTLRTASDFVGDINTLFKFLINETCVNQNILFGAFDMHLMF